MLGENMRAVIKNAEGTLEVDPYNRIAQVDRWVRAVKNGSTVDYTFFGDLSPKHSELLTRYLLDLRYGRNTAKGIKRGARSASHIMATKNRLHSLLKKLEQYTGRKDMDFEEEEIIYFFEEMRSGEIKKSDGSRYLAAGDFARVFAAFWRWHKRIRKKNGVFIQDIAQDLDTSQTQKPKWCYFTLEGARKMALRANLEYRALIFFGFDSGIRSPKEMMNVRVSDLTESDDPNYLLLTIRSETSKTFGRTIKLMLSSQVIRDYIATYHLEEDAFLFSKNPETYNRTLKRLGYEALGIGEAHYINERDRSKPRLYVRGGVTLYDLRHNSACYYLPRYKTESQMMYRYGWTNPRMIYYYSEFLGMRDNIREEDMRIGPGEEPSYITDRCGQEQPTKPLSAGETVSHQKKYCPSCGQSHAHDANWCSACGAPLDSQTSTPNHAISQNVDFTNVSK